VTLNGGRMIFHFSIPPFNVTRISEYAAIAALEDQAYLKDVTAKNAKEPTRKPANPYALENVLNKNALSNRSCNFNVSG
jgi:histidinol-phosphate/aromatic aminotransferase/cobyric acid decarboxylase-like protein